MSITGTITLDAPIPPLRSNLFLNALITDYAFHDGRRTISPSAPGASIVFAVVSTDSTGRFVFWNFLFEDDFGQITTQNDISVRSHLASLCGTPGCPVADRDIASLSSPLAPGSWTLVPEPATASLLLAGLAALATRRRGRG